MANNSLSDILDQIGSFSETLASQREQTSELYSQRDDLLGQGVEDAVTAGNLQGIITAENNAQNLMMEQRKAAVGSVYGVDILDPNSQVAVLASQGKNLFDQAMAQQQHISNLQSMNIWDDPVAYLTQKPFVGREIASFNAKAAQYNAVDARINDLNKEAESTLAISQKINSTFSNEEAAANLELAAMKATDAVRAIRLTQNAGELEGLKALSALNSDTLKNQVTGYRLQREAEEFNARAKEREAAAEERKREFDERMRQRREQMDVKSFQAKQEGMALEAYNFGADELGLAPASSIQDIKIRNRADTQDIISRGQKIQAQLYGTDSPKQIDSVFAKSVGDAYINLNKIAGSNLGSTAGRVEDFVQQVGRRTTTSLKEKKVTVTAQNADSVIPQAINEYLYGYKQVIVTKGGGNQTVDHPGLVLQMVSNAEAQIDGYGNIYKAPDPDTIASAMPSLKKEAWWNEVVEKAKVARGGLPSASDLLTQARIAIKEGKLDPNQAGDVISNYYKAAVLTNKQTNRYERVGLPPQTTYIAYLDMPESGKVKVDMLDPVQTTRAMMQYRVEELRKKTGFLSPLFGTFSK